MNKKILLYIILGIVVFTMVIFSVFPNMTYAIKDFGKSAAGNSDDLCSPPQGVSVEEWNTHMSHHPNMYKDCLE